MSSTEIRLVFGGREVESGKIDASVLGNALTGYNELFRRANELANGEASQAVVFVESDFKTGSFDVTVQLVQTLIENAKSLITAHPFLSAAELAAAIGLVVWHKRESLIGVLKWLRGHKPDKVTQRHFGIRRSRSARSGCRHQCSPTSAGARGNRAAPGPGLHRSPD